MDDEIILKALSFLSTDDYIDHNVCREGLPEGTFAYLCKTDLIESNSGVTGIFRYRRTPAGNQWIQDYHRRKQTDAHQTWMFWMTFLILLLTLVLVLHAFLCR